MKDVKIAYAKAHLSELVERASRGERITISRYNRAMAELGPAPQIERPKPKLGTLKGKVKLVDPALWTH